MKSNKVKIGTRGSKLALWQAYHVEELLNKVGIGSEIIVIETKGDKILDKSLSKIGSKGVFTEELEEGLKNGDLDIAIHSAKDMQSSIAEGTELIAYTKREKVNDVVISVKGKIDLTSDHVKVATSSTRRRAQVRKYFPNAKLVDVRGNLQTRIQKLRDGIADVLLLAYAGVHRMEYDQLISEELVIDKFIPSVGQGSIGIQCSSSLSEELKNNIRKACNDNKTEICLIAERTMLKILNGGCSVPVFGNAVIKGSVLKLTGGVIDLDGKTEIKESLEKDVEEARLLGEEVANALNRRGAKELLEKIRKNIN